MENRKVGKKRNRSRKDCEAKGVCFKTEWEKMSLKEKIDNTSVF